MKLLLKIFLILLIAFSSTFIVLNITELLTISTIKDWFHTIHNFSPLVIALFVIGLLMIDLYLSVPTLPVVILAGYYLGFWEGAIASITGLLLAGILGYTLSRKFGLTLIQKLYTNQKELDEMKQLFNSNAKLVFLFCRALPMLPEITSCLAGVNKMPIKQYLFWYLLGTVPYVLIASFSGSLSDIHNPWPAIYTGIGLLSVMGLVWFVAIHKRKLNFNLTRDA
jgi:uncharacterized membrane protein YdjX (TVP38/TMEM64 family)